MQPTVSKVLYILLFIIILCCVIEHPSKKEIFSEFLKDAIRRLDGTAKDAQPKLVVVVREPEGQSDEQLLRGRQVLGAAVAGESAEAADALDRVLRGLQGAIAVRHVDFTEDAFKRAGLIWWSTTEVNHNNPPPQSPPG